MPSTPKHPPLLISQLSQQRVFSQLSAKSRDTLAGQFTLANATAGATLAAQGRLPDQLGLILSGTVRLSDPDLNLSVQLEVGNLFGFGVTPAPQLATWQAVAAADCEVAWLAADVLAQLCTKHPQLAFFLPSLQPAHQPPAVPAPPVSESSNALNLLGTPIRSLIKRPPITVAPDTSIQATAVLMRDRRVSSVLLVEQGLLFGLVTDRDLRNRVVALDLDISRPVSDIATLAPMTVSANSPAFEALLLMARHNIHHIPVMEGGDILGMITATDLTEQHSTSAVYLAGDIYKQSSLDGLKSISTRVRQLQQHLAAADASAYSTGHIITAITDAITIRLIHLAEAQLGPAPVDYVWVAAGSQARNEQTAKSDQDNCLILDDAFDEAAHGAYFKTFSKFVCDGLAECGYIHCPGEMMAMTDIWRQPRRVWAEYFRKWVDSPKPKSLMLTCVFFDLRAIHGQAALLDGLRQQVVQHTKGNSLFLAHMVSNALKHRPPLGMFGQITLIKGGDNPHTIDLKHTGIVPIVDLARVYALAAGVTVANTHDRLEVSAQAGEVTEQSARDLRGALEFLGKLRIAHQARQMAQGQAPDNFLALEELSNFERSHLKEAFSVVQTLQGVLGQRYAGGRF
ncbi:putative nucleotidyltransferase substrate binding domain-containing protein [Rhodoferax sp.]|uniref:putative nucleotidyltransferase substrate binding domain-containing protein n=1 Tax=Rhodoferax sp. TaxID=50421 RepID=UPI002724D839|nr:putative nucleotidyltransferase substrate binding domain-containing protein [Rhodoferax sp.]MDO9143608.1 putative nucleotidyltransferase substrate binding domain-containing protein [Rhodoferax sp.]MDP3865715.1 putative nucleotidyltransferase substrate binding domain-containing protein [Rhodoferax sp.]